MGDSNTGTTILNGKIVNLSEFHKMVKMSVKLKETIECKDCRGDGILISRRMFEGKHYIFYDCSCIFRHNHIADHNRLVDQFPPHRLPQNDPPKHPSQQ